eukprot:m.107985 g.107985  ORF g.107985 m.107985 type:complete len:365 (+) comp8994_c0_seq5:528-1622(+)
MIRVTYCIKRGSSAWAGPPPSEMDDQSALIRTHLQDSSGCQGSSWVSQARRYRWEQPISVREGCDSSSSRDTRVQPHTDTLATRGQADSTLPRTASSKPLMNEISRSSRSDRLFTAASTPAGVSRGSAFSRRCRSRGAARLRAAMHVSSALETRVRSADVSFGQPFQIVASTAADSASTPWRSSTASAGQCAATASPKSSPRRRRPRTQSSWRWRPCRSRNGTSETFEISSLLASESDCSPWTWSRAARASSVKPVHVSNARCSRPRGLAAMARAVSTAIFMELRSSRRRSAGSLSRKTATSMSATRKQPSSTTCSRREQCLPIVRSACSEKGLSGSFQHAREVNRERDIERDTEEQTKTRGRW